MFGPKVTFFGNNNRLVYNRQQNYKSPIANGRNYHSNFSKFPLHENFKDSLFGKSAFPSNDLLVKIRTKLIDVMKFTKPLAKQVSPTPLIKIADEVLNDFSDAVKNGHHKEAENILTVLNSVDFQIYNMTEEEISRAFNSASIEGNKVKAFYDSRHHRVLMPYSNEKSNGKTFIHEMRHAFVFYKNFPPRHDQSTSKTDEIDTFRNYSAWHKDQFPELQARFEQGFKKLFYLSTLLGLEEAGSTELNNDQRKTLANYHELANNYYVPNVYEDLVSQEEFTRLNIAESIKQEGVAFLTTPFKFMGRDLNKVLCINQYKYNSNNNTYLCTYSSINQAAESRLKAFLLDVLDTFGNYQQYWEFVIDKDLQEQEYQRFSEWDAVVSQLGILGSHIFSEVIAFREEARPAYLDVVTPRGGKTPSP